MRNLSIRAAVLVLKFVVPVAILSWLIWRVDAEEWRALRTQEKSYAVLAVALVLAFVAVCMTFVRWALLVRCHGIPLRMTEAFRLGAIGFLLSFVSAGSVGGDVFKAVFLARRSEGRRLEAVASVFVDRALGLYGLLLLVVAVLIIAPPSTASKEFHQLAIGAGALALIGTMVLVTLVAGGRWIDAMLNRVGNRRWIGRAVHRVADPLRVFHTHPLHFVAGLFISIGVHGLLSASIYLIARGLYAAPPTLAEHMLIVPAGTLAAALPITPAGLGLLEAAMAWLYEIVPAVPTEASGTLVALVFEIVRVVLAGFGVLFYWSSNPEVRESLEAIERLDSVDETRRRGA